MNQENNGAMSAQQFMINGAEPSQNGIDMSQINAPGASDSQMKMPAQMEVQSNALQGSGRDQGMHDDQMQQQQQEQQIATGRDRLSGDGDAENPEEEQNFQFYKEYCRLYYANIILTNRLQQLLNEKKDLQFKLNRLESNKRAHEEALGMTFDIAEEKRKRHRRTATEIARHYHCPIEDCPKSYGSEGSLNQHLKLKHKEYYKAMQANSSAHQNYLNQVAVVAAADNEARKQEANLHSDDSAAEMESKSNQDQSSQSERRFHQSRDENEPRMKRMKLSSAQEQSSGRIHNTQELSENPGEGKKENNRQPKVGHGQFQSYANPKQMHAKQANANPDDREEQKDERPQKEDSF